MVGHVTKDGTVAGPKTLEHMVDVVLTLEGERGGALRLLRGAKNRFGSCEETGVFAMGTAGLTAVPDPSAMLLADRGHDVPGSIVFPGMEGSRPLLIELQALVTKSKFPRRVAIGLDQRRVELLTGVMNERLSLELSESEIYASASGGLAIKEPAADLPIALSLWSAKRNVSLPSGMVAFGEIGLGGEVRRVPSAERRLSEAARLGFQTAIVPRGVEGAPASLRVIGIDHLGRAGALFDTGANR
jgi:DNA repair protein RadA/Sms